MWQDVKLETVCCLIPQTKKIRMSFKTKKTKRKFHLITIYSAQLCFLAELEIWMLYYGASDTLDLQSHYYSRKNSTATQKPSEVLDRDIHLISHQPLWKTLLRVAYWFHPSLTSTNQTIQAVPHYSLASKSSEDLDIQILVTYHLLWRCACLCTLCGL